MDMLYPNYTSAGFFKDEEGFLAPTPYGDVADVLLSDAPLWLLQRYPVMVVGGALSVLPREARRKLEAYVAAGGIAVLSTETVSTLGEAFGVQVDNAPVHIPANASYSVNTSAMGSPTVSPVHEPYPAELLPLKTTNSTQATVVASVGSSIAALRIEFGKGFVLVLASSGVAAQPQCTLPIQTGDDTTLPVPFPMLAHVRALMGAIFKAHAAIFDVPAGLSVVVGRRHAGAYTVLVSNSDLEEHPLSLQSNIGPILSVTEEPLDQGEKYSSGYLPAGYEQAPIGRSTNTSIAGGDVRIFDVEVTETASLIHSPAPTGPEGRMLPVTGGVYDAVLSRPTFMQHWDGAVVDWRHVERTEPASLTSEGRWATQRGIRLVVDFTAGLNLYPDLRLCSNSAGQYEASLQRIEAVLAKMSLPVNASTATLSSAMYSRSAVITAHRAPENYYSAEQCQADFVAAFRRLARFAASRGLTLYLRTEENKLNLASALQIYSAVGSPAIRMAPSTALLEWDGIHTVEQLHSAFPALHPEDIGMWFAAATSADPLVPSMLLSAHAPLSGGSGAALALTSFAPHAAIVFDAQLPDIDAEVEEAEALHKAEGPQFHENHDTIVV